MHRILQETAKKGLDPHKFAQQVVTISEAPKPKTRYAFSKNYLTNWLVPRYLMTDRIMDQVIHRELIK